MKNFLFKLLLGLLVLSGCSREEESTIPVLDKSKGFGTSVTEKSENNEITYRFKDGVSVWNDNTTQFIEKVVADTILYIKNNAPKDMIPAVGDILSCSINEQLPYGLGNKVLSVTKVDDAYKCVTTLAPLDELFEELVVHATIPLTESIVDGVYDTDGYFHPVKDASRAELKLNPITFKLDKKIHAGSDSIAYKGTKITGEIEIGLFAVVDINLMEHTHEFSLTAEGGFFAGVEASFKSPEKIKEKIIDVPKLFQSVVMIGPLVLRPFVNFKAGLVAGVEGSLITGFSKPFGMKIGIKDGAFFKENLLTDNQDNIISEFEWNAAGYAGAYSELGFGVGLYTTKLAVSLDPKLSAIANASFKNDMEDLLQVKPELGFNVLLDFDGHFTLDLGKNYYYRKQETFASWPLYEISWPILPSLVDNSVTIEEDKNKDHLTFTVGYDYTGGLLSLFTDIKPIFRVYDELGDIKYYTTDKKLTTDKEPQHFEFEVTGLQYDKDYIGKPGVELLGLKFDEKGINFKAESPVDENNGEDGGSGTGTDGSDDNEGEEGGGTPVVGCDSCAAGHCHTHNFFSQKSQSFTGVATDITDKSAIVYGTFQGLSSDMEFGIVFYTDNNNENFVKGIYNENNNEYTFSLNELTPDTEYYYMSYILVDNQYIYGERMNFRTLPKQFEFRFIAESSSDRFPDVNEIFSVESEDYFNIDINGYSIEYSKNGDLEHAWDETNKSKIRISVADDSRNFNSGAYQGGDLFVLWFYSNSFNVWFSPSLEVVYTVWATPVKRNKGDDIESNVKIKLEKIED